MNSVFKALSHPARRKIIAMLQRGPLTSGQIAAAFDMAWPSVTGHLAALKGAELLESERDGNTIRYRLNISAAEEAVGFLLGMTQAAKPARKAAKPSSRERTSLPRTTARKKPA